MKTYSGFIWLDADQGDQLIEWLCLCGASILLSGSREGLCFRSFSDLQCPVMNRLSTSVLSAVSYIIYIIVCV